MASVPRIGIDAMGGDFGPSVVAEGTALAFKEMPGQFEIVLVGDEAEIGHSLKRVHANGYPIEVVHAAERIEMSEKAVMAARKNKSSLGVLTQLHKERRIDAMFSAGNTRDVVVTDGFTGNVVLKTAESVAGQLAHMVREELHRDWLARAGALLMLPSLKRVKQRIDWEEYGAAPLLGINGVCFIGHGASGVRAFRSAIRTLTRFVEQRVNEHIREEIEADHDSAA